LTTAAEWLIQAAQATPSEVATAVLTAAQTTPIHANIQTINDAEVIGTGTMGDSWRGIGVQPGSI
jgi:hypothetical protein